MRNLFLVGLLAVSFSKGFGASSDSSSDNSPPRKKKIASVIMRVGDKVITQETFCEKGKLKTEVKEELLLPPYMVGEKYAKQLKKFQKGPYGTLGDEDGSKK